MCRCDVFSNRTDSFVVEGCTDAIGVVVGSVGESAASVVYVVGASVEYLVGASVVYLVGASVAQVGGCVVG